MEPIGSQNAFRSMIRSYKPITRIILFVGIAGCTILPTHSPDIAPNPVVPTDGQVAYQGMEFIGFIHFSMNTFTDREWGYGDESPELFNPTQLDAEQWARTAYEAGMKELILTAKHHDGFCLWPSKHTEHSIINSPYKNGNGDIVGEFVEACRKYGLKAGLYLSPWDRNHADYGKPEYITYYRNQLEELLTQYGEISEIWFDGANGGDGYYGGANEVRHIDRENYYDWETTVKMVKKWQPEIMIFSDAGPDVRWIGNESGFAGEEFWSAIDRDTVIIGAANTAYLNKGDPDGKDWVVGQCDVSIRPGWFYHASQDSLVKKPQELVDIYYKSVGRNALLLLNLPPDHRGLIHENDVQSLVEFRAIIDETFACNLLQGSEIEADNWRLNHKKFAPGNILDGNPETYWATDDSISSTGLHIFLRDSVQFDRIMIREPIKFGQRISRFEIHVETGHGWQKVFEGTTIGYKRLIRIEPVVTSGIMIKILGSNNTMAISEVGVFKAASGEE